MNLKYEQMYVGILNSVVYRKLKNNKINTISIYIYIVKFANVL